MKNDNLHRFLIKGGFARGTQVWNSLQEFTPIWGLLWWRLPEYKKRIIDDEIWYSWKELNVDKEFVKR